MDLQTIFSEAVHFHTQGRLQEAKKKYEMLLQELPENINILGNIGLVCKDLGQLDEALEYTQKTVELSPDDASQHLNLGAVFEARGDLSAARRCYEKALQLFPSHPKALNNLGKLCHLEGQTSEAVTYLQRALAMEPDYPLALNNLGVLLSEKGDKEGAMTYLGKSYKLDPNNVNTLFNLAGLYGCSDQGDKAIKLLDELLNIDPDHKSAEHLLASLKGEVTQTAPPQYVTEIFDRYAPRFDRHLQGPLGYTVPFALAEMVEEWKPSPEFSSGLDLGCGTGISGEAFKEICTELVGVDLSPRMLEKAEGKDLYSAVYCEDISSFLNRNQKKYDLFLVADVLIYIGSIDTFFHEVAKNAHEGALLACSIENCSSVDTYTLCNSGRYAHNPDYLCSKAEEAGFRVISHREHNIRKEEKNWIPGDLYILQFGNDIQSGGN